jgi:hypothetical protein
LEIFWFLGNVQGLVSPNIFQVEFTVNGLGDELNKIPYLCHTSSIPFPTFSEGKIFYNNRDHKIATKEDYDPITMSFYIDVHSSVPKLLKDWMDLIIDPTTKQMGYRKDYVGSADITLYDSWLMKKIHIKIHELWPININALELSWNTKDTISEIPVDFNYDYIEYEMGANWTKSSLTEDVRDKMATLGGDAKTKINEAANRATDFRQIV